MNLLRLSSQLAKVARKKKYSKIRDLKTYGTYNTVLSFPSYGLTMDINCWLRSTLMREMDSHAEMFDARILQHIVSVVFSNNFKEGDAHRHFLQ